jgi:hypothetical protein
MVHRHNRAMGFDNPIKFHTFIHEIEIPSGKDEKRRQGEDSRKGGKWKSMKADGYQIIQGDRWQGPKGQGRRIQKEKMREVLVLQF